MLEALGDLLAHNAYVADTTEKRLAARAYLQAARVVTDPEARAGYRQLAREALTLQTRDPASQVQLTIEEVEPQFDIELADAERWYAELKAKEAGWIASGADPEAEFDKLYTEEPTIGDEPTDAISRFWFDRHRTEVIVGSVLGVSVVVVISILLNLRRRRGRSRW